MDIYWSSHAESQFEEIFEQLKDQWGEKTAYIFVDSVFDQIVLISKFPGMYPRLEDYPDLRKCFVNRHVKLIYHPQERSIEIVAFNINRMDND